MSEDFKKQVQEKLLQVQKLLDECVELAERGSFQFHFNSPGKYYYPTKLYTDEDINEYLAETEGVDWDVDLTDEEREERLVDARAEYQREELPEYAEPGSWWVPSRNC